MKKLWDIICPSQKDCPQFEFLTNMKLHSHYLVSGMDDGKYLNWIFNATKLTNEEWHSISGDTAQPEKTWLEAVTLFSCWTSHDMVIFGLAKSSLTISSLWELVKEGESSSWCLRFSGFSWGSETPSLASLVLSSATGDAKLNLTEAALTNVSTGDKVWGGSLWAANAGACSSLILSWTLEHDQWPSACPTKY